MKIFKGILYTLVILLVSILIAAFLAPTDIIIERSVLICANQERVFDEIVDFKKWYQWDPWYPKDTTQKRNYVGKFGDTLYGYSWSSKEKNVGNGSMFFTNISNKDSISYAVTFGRDDDEQKSSGSFYLQTLGENTQVVWTLKSSLAYPYKFLNFFLDDIAGKDFEIGLEGLKSHVEKVKKIH
jgi:hypothetical protein